MTFTENILLILILFGLSNSTTLNSINQTRHYPQPSKGDCYYKGHRLYGRIQIVDSFSDVKVQIVNSFPDLKVKVVDSLPNKCGEWQIVTEFPDLKVQFVNSFSDIKIQYVQSFPGLTSKK